MENEKTKTEVINPLANLTIADIQAKTAVLNASIQSQLRAFEADTGCKVHSVQVHQDRPPLVRTIVKVQIPGA